MTVRVLFFSVLRDLAGESELRVTCDPGVHTVGDLLAQLYTRWPKLAEWDKALLLAVDQAYVKRDALLHENAEVALMPPVQGG